MKPPPAPIRFLLLAVGGWIGFRLVVLVPDWSGPAGLPPGEAVATAPTRQPFASAAPSDPPPPEAVPTRGTRLWPGAPSPTATVQSPVLLRQGAAVPEAPRMEAAMQPLQILSSLVPAAPPSRAFPPSALPPALPAMPPPFSAPQPNVQAPQRRLAGSAWIFLREGSAAPGFAPGGTLGGSQAGARLTYRLNNDTARPLALSARLYAPLDRPQGAEVALGVDWRPLARLPVHVLAERRQAIGREGRSDFALTVYGGGELRRGRLRAEAYAQAGIVGVEERDLFADGAGRIGIAAGPVEAGAGLWGGAQPGAARLDAGPQVTARLSAGRVNLRASAEWRFRLAGDAAPGSGPALTIGADF